MQATAPARAIAAHNDARAAEEDEAGDIALARAIAVVTPAANRATVEDPVTRLHLRTLHVCWLAAHCRLAARGWLALLHLALLLAALLHALLAAPLGRRSGFAGSPLLLGCGPLLRCSLRTLRAATTTVFTTTPAFATALLALALPLAALLLLCG
jgi:hypothetical protein